MTRVDRRAFLGIAGAVATSGVAYAAPATFAFIDRNRSDFAIFVRPGSPPGTLFGANELQTFLQEASGVRLPIASPAQVQSGAFKALLSLGSATMANEAYRIRVRRTRIDIEGGGARGALYGCYGFLEDLVGCRWFTPTVRVVPRRHTLWLTEGDHFGAPQFQYREPYYREALDRDWAVRNRLNGPFSRLPESMGGGIEYAGRIEAGSFVHTFAQLVPPDEYFADHPEWFGERDGRRQRDAQLCLTNPGVRAALISRVRTWLVANPRASIVSVSQNDDYRLCRCIPCTAAMVRFGAPSGLVLDLVNAVAEDLARHHPDVAVDTLAYQWTEIPPAIRPRANVRITFAAMGRCFSHGIDECERNGVTRARLDGWVALNSNLHIWDYGANFSSFFRPLPNLDALGADLRAFRKRGVTGVFVEGSYVPGGGGEMAELRSYLLAKLLWDPSRSVWSLVDEFVSAVYAGAAPYVGAWLRALHAEVRDASLHAGIFDGPDAPYLTRWLLQRGTELFGHAEAAAGSSEVLRRLETARLPLDMTILERGHVCDAKRTDLLGGVERALRSRAVQFVSENQSVEDWLAKVRQGTS